MLDYLKIESNKLMTKKMVDNNWELILFFLVIFGLGVTPLKRGQFAHC